MQRTLDFVDDVTADRISSALEEQSDVAWDSEFDRQTEVRLISNENALKLVDGHLKILELVEAAPATAALHLDFARARADLTSVRRQIQRDLT